jgi:hypothetical protein
VASGGSARRRRTRGAPTISATSRAGSASGATHFGATPSARAAANRRAIDLLGQQQDEIRALQSQVAALQEAGAGLARKLRKTEPASALPAMTG